MNLLEKLKAEKRTENGDIAYNKTGSNPMLDILFMSEYYQKHLKEVPKLGVTAKEKVFAMFMRDPRFGVGRRDLGRELMSMTKVLPEHIVKAGRFDDLWKDPLCPNLDFLFEEVKSGNELAKKWCPRLNSKDSKTAKALCKYWRMSEREYRKLIKCDTTENKLSRHRIDDIKFEQVPSLAMIKYYKRFMLEDRFVKYIESVKKGEKKMNISTSTIYDIYRNRESIDADLFFDKIEKIKINCIPILDTSGSMWDSNDSIGKAMCIAHYLAKCSTYAPNQVISFSSNPQVINIETRQHKIVDYWGRTEWTGWKFGSANDYCKELSSMYTGDCTNTDFGAVMRLLIQLGKEAPEYFVVLSDMEFDIGSSMSKERTMQYFKSIGIKTKIIWWNFNARSTTVPETDEYGNIYISGYSPQMLKYLECGFDGNEFLDKLLLEYQQKAF